MQQPFWKHDLLCVFVCVPPNMPLAVRSFQTQFSDVRIRLKIVFSFCIMTYCCRCLLPFTCSRDTLTVHICPEGERCNGSLGKCRSDTMVRYVQFLTTIERHISHGLLCRSQLTAADSTQCRPSDRMAFTMPNDCERSSWFLGGASTRSTGCDAQHASCVSTIPFK